MRRQRGGGSCRCGWGRVEADAFSRSVPVPDVSDPKTNWLLISRRRLRRRRKRGRRRLEGGNSLLQELQLRDGESAGRGREDDAQDFVDKPGRDGLTLKNHLVSGGV